MKKEKEIIWIFLHLPKTGGSTFSDHIMRSLKKDEFLDITQLRYGFEKRNLDLKSMKKIKVILGHASYYGIHKFFPEKTPRYIVFLRDPAERFVSAYNFEMRVKEGKNLPFWKWYGAQPKNDMVLFMDMKYRGKEGTKANIPNILLRGFYKIFKSKKITYFFQKTFEKYHKIFLSSNKKMEVKLRNSKNLLDLCWYVGIIPGLDNDLAYLFKEIGIPSKWENQNVTEKSKIYFKLDENSLEKIKKDNSSDFELYDYAKSINKKKIFG